MSRCDERENQWFPKTRKLCHNETMVAKALNAKQKSILQWISIGCPPEKEPANFKLSARMLEGHGLVKIKGRGAKWSATITPRGQRVLAGTECLVPPKKRGRKAGHHPLDREEAAVAQQHLAQHKPLPQREKADETVINDWVDQVVTKVLSDEFHRANFSIDSQTYDTVWKYVLKKVANDLRLTSHGAVITRETGGWRRVDTIAVQLCQESPMIIADYEALTSGRKRIGKYHRLVDSIMKSSKCNVQPENIPRAKRIVHVVLTEAEKRGWDVSMKEGRVEIHPPHGAGYTIMMREHYNTTERPPTKKEIDEHNRYSYRCDSPMKKFYEHTFTSRLILRVERYNERGYKDTVREPDRLNRAIADFFRAADFGSQWARVEAIYQKRQQDLRELKVAEAQRRAAKIHRERSYQQSLIERARRYQDFLLAQEYVAALKNDPALAHSEWATWAGENLETLNPRNYSEIPSVEPFRSWENSALIDSIVRQLSDNPDEWNSE